MMNKTMKEIAKEVAKMTMTLWVNQAAHEHRE
jgi:hypothetical protein